MPTKFLYTLFLIFIASCGFAEEKATNSVYQNQMQLLDETQNKVDKTVSEWNKIFDKRKLSFSENLNKLAAIDTKLKKTWSYSGLTRDHEFVVRLWRSFADHSFDNISGASFQRSLPEIPKLNIQQPEYAALFSEGQIKTISQKMDSLESSLRKALATFELCQEQDSLAYSRVLLSSGKLRSKQHQRLIQLGNHSVQSFNSDNLADLWREIRIIPVRWTATFYSKILEFRDNGRAGMTGYLYIGKEIALFLFLLGFGFFFIWTFQKIVLRFENLAEKFLKKINTSKTHWLVPYSLTIANKSIPWVLLFFGVWFFISLIEITAFNELSNLLPYLDYYIYYRLALIFTTSFYFRLKAIGKIAITFDQQTKLIRSIISVYRFIIISIAALHTIDTVVGKALTYAIVLKLIKYIAFGYLLLLVNKWKSELTQAYQKQGFTKITSFLSPSLRQRFSIVMSFLFLVILVANGVYKWFFHWLSKFDQFKKFTALIFISKLNKAQVSKSETVNYDLPDTYKEAFFVADKSNTLFADRREFKTALCTINAWLDGKESNHSMVIYGSSGNGKTTLLNHLSRQIPTVENRRISFKDKVNSESELLGYLRNALGGDLEDVDGLIEYWKSNIDHKMVVYIDDAHNLFLSQLNGFGAIRLLMKIINSDIENIFWCVSFHRYSWTFISKVLERYQCFDEVIELAHWSAEEIQSFIMGCHKKTQLKLSFEDILMMLGEHHHKEARENIESRFFKLLWEQSDGNPARAVSIWFRSLKFNGLDTLKVIRPPIQDMSYLMDLNDEVHFVCASLTRHEYLNRKQLEITTNQDSGIVTRVVKYALEKNLITQNAEGYYALNPDYAGYIIRSLRRKNYVYG